jgi:hypothetical protein
METLTVVIVLLTVPRLISGHAEGERKSRWERPAAAAQVHKYF